MTTVKEFRDSIHEDAVGYISAVFGDGSPEDPMRFFEDAILTVSYEKYNDDGSFNGWGEDKLELKEYFERKMRGK